MGDRFSWNSPSSRMVLSAVLEVLTEAGFDGLTVERVRAAAGPAGAALDDDVDIEELVIAALTGMTLFAVPAPTGSLRDDLRALLRPWQAPRTRDEVVVAALIGAAERRPQLRAALLAALDRPLAQVIGEVLTRAVDGHEVPVRNLQALGWVLRALTLDRLRMAEARSAVDIDHLVDVLIDGLRSSRPCVQQTAGR